MSWSETPNDVRLRLLFKDKDFRRDTNRLKRKLLKSAKAKSADEYWISSLEKGELFQFREIVELIDGSLLKLYDSILNNYNISKNELGSYFDNSIATGDAPIIFGGLSLELNTVDVHIRPHARKEDLESAWQGIREQQKLLKDYKHRNTQPYSVDIVWAIHKQRKKKTPWNIITSLLNSGELPGCKEKRPGWNANHVKNYYHRNKKYVLKTGA